MTKDNLNYFSSSEHGAVQRFKEFRDRAVKPLAKLLSGLGISADILSYVGLLSLLGFIIFVVESPRFAVLFLLLHVTLDALDGPVARVSGNDGNSGAFTDMFVDHTGIVIVILTLMYYNLLNPILGAIYVYLYTIMIVFVVVLNSLDISPKFVLRTKYLVYLLYAYFAFTQINYFTEAVALFSISILPFVFRDYISLKRYFRNEAKR
jgi:phosphatidylglycerophosphate synthase